MIGWIFSLFVMHHYELDKEKMQEINRKKCKKKED